MSGMIGGLFGGGEDSGGSTTNISQTQGQKNNQMINYQDPNSPVAGFSSQYVREEGDRKDNGFSLADLYRAMQQQQTQNTGPQMQTVKPTNTSRPGGIMSMFMG